VDDTTLAIDVSCGGRELTAALRLVIREGVALRDVARAERTAM
jgi:hypothetical protein